MTYVKVNNLIQTGGNADYKGLDLSLIVGGTQIFFTTNERNEAYFGYSGEVVEHPDVETITEEQYQAAKQESEESFVGKGNPSPNDEIQHLRLELDEMKLSIAELAEEVQKLKEELLNNAE